MGWSVRLFLAGAAWAVSHSPAAAATIVILTDPMTLERRTVVLDTAGPDRVLWCMAPPATVGCRDITPARR